jgi:branched-chain amino acid aminotransferase
LQYFVCPVSAIHHRGVDVTIPMANGDSGAYTAKLKSWMKDIMYGNVDHPWGVVVNEKE